MNKQILNIVNFQILYEILDEIKENLFFEIVNYKDKNEFLKNSKTTLQQELVITKDKTFSEGNVLFIDNFPIPLNKLIELVNIQLLKIKFNSQAKIKIKDYDLDLNSKFFSKEKINFKRSKVGDRYVKELMKKNNYNLGGEQSGHIILGKFATTGDGLLVALECLFALRKRKIASELFKVYQSVPQKLINIKVKNKEIINTPKCKKAIKLANHIIKNKGRLLVRLSGTEPKIRIMCESFNSALLNSCIKIVRRSIN